MKPPPLQLTKGDKTFEWIAGPYRPNERWMLKNQIKEFEKTGVNIHEETKDGATFLYRDKKGYLVTPRVPVYDTKDGDNFKYTPSETRKFLKEIQEAVKAKQMTG